MKNLGLFYFSGTGNTKLVTSLIAEEFEKLGWAVSIFNIEEINMKEQLPNLESLDLIGIGAQVIAYSTPRRMKQFIQLLPNSKKNESVFIYRTCGGVSKDNYVASHSMIRTLRKKKYHVMYERLFSIGSNWMIKFDDSIMQQLYIATSRKIKIMCKELVVEGKERFYETSVFQRLKFAVIAFFAGLVLPFIAKDMKVSKNCSKCKICINHCPENNICMKNGEVHFGSGCTACLRCIYNCPKQAIDFRNLKFIKVKEGYNLEKSLSSVESETKKEIKVPPFFAKYISDDDM